MAFDAKGLLGNPLFMMGMGGLTDRGSTAGMMRGLLGAGQYAQQVRDNAGRGGPQWSS